MPYRPAKKNTIHAQLGAMFSNKINAQRLNFARIEDRIASRGKSIMRPSNSKYSPHVGAKQLARLAKPLYA
tara:strand:- start:315 stop:527 length:213 start_codon:yes stop_codon:yes gene_type:complete